jgi:hypothetical protein
MIQHRWINLPLTESSCNQEEETRLRSEEDSPINQEEAAFDQ